MTGQVPKEAAVGVGICGILLFACGVVNLTAGMILAENKDSNTDGLWSCVFLLIPGILGVITWYTRNKGAVAGFLVVTIIAILAEFVQSIIAGIRYSFYRSGWGRCGSSSGRDCKSLTDSLLAIIISSVIGGIVSLIGSIFGCIGCCGTQDRPGTIVVQQPAMIATISTTSVQQPGYQAPQYVYSNYMAPQPTYYPAPQSANYSAPQPTNYPAPQSANYSAPQPTNYPAPQSASYSAPQPTNYPAPQSDDYSAPQPTNYSNPPQATQQAEPPEPDEPPPVYTKHPV